MIVIVHCIPRCLFPIACNSLSRQFLLQESFGQQMFDNFTKKGHLRPNYIRGLEVSEGRSAGDRLRNTPVEGLAFMSGAYRGSDELTDPRQE